MIAIIDYKAGNLRSVERALRHLDLECIITRDSAEILNAERVIFPGVGAAGKAMETISELGIDKVIRKVIDSGIPFMGICLGTQIILERSEEDNARCLGIINGTTRRFPEMGLKIPHMGWNTLNIRKDHPILHGIDQDASFYFVHSYYPDPEDALNIFAETEYGISFPSAIGRNNVFASQFHPEKSGRSGLKMLENFSKWDGRM